MNELKLENERLSVKNEYLNGQLGNWENTKEMFTK